MKRHRRSFSENHKRRPCERHRQAALAHALLPLLLLLGAGGAVAQGTSTLEKVRRSNTLTCGIDQSEAEFSTTEDHGARVAFDQDLCKAVAVAILGPSARILTHGYPDDLTATNGLRSGEVDLIPTLTSDYSHMAGSSVGFTRPVLYDGVGFLVPANSNAKLAAELSQQKICLLAETEVEVEVRAWFASQHLTFFPFPFQEQGEMEAAFVTNNCAALAGDITRLAQTRASLAAHRADYRLLPEIISSDPLAAAFRTSDTSFGSVVQWTLEALVQAESLGLTAENITGRQALDPAAERLLGATHELGRPLGLQDDWVARTIKAVGNYAQVFDRDLGGSSPMGLPRGQNALSQNGGLLQALPFK